LLTPPPVAAWDAWAEVCGTGWDTSQQLGDIRCGHSVSAALLMEQSPAPKLAT